MVHELINDDFKCWDEEKTNENFVPVDAAAMCEIPIGRFFDDDWAWFHEKSGNFSVRSAYRMLAAQQLSNDNASASSGSSTFCWKILWGFSVPPKVRAFWWRVIKNFVPCRQNLKVRHMEQIGHCKIYGTEEETAFHALFERSWAHDFWPELKQSSGVKIPTLHPISWPTDLVAALWFRRKIHA